MKKQREIVSNRPLISDAEIDGLKTDYQSLTQNYKTFAPKAMIKGITGWSAGIIGAAVIGVSSWYLASNQGADKSSADKNVVSVAQDSSQIPWDGVKPPIPELDKMEIYSVNNSKPTEIITERGNKIIIPANSFVDSKNNPISGKVDILFKDYHNPLENFLSGIPMTYDSAGVNYTFESAGMFKIFAKQNGENVYLASNKTIEVELVTTNEEVFNQYYYDTIANNWKYLKTEKKDDIELFADKLTQIEEEIEESSYNLGKPQTTEVNPKSSSIIANKQNVVRKHDKTRFAIKIPQKENLVNSADSLGDRVFEIYPDQKFKQEYYSVKWTDKIVVPDKKEGDYLISLIKGDTKLTFRGYLVEDPSEEYDKQMEIAKQKKAEKDARKIRKDEEMAAIRNLRSVQENMNQFLKQGMVGTRSVTIINLGIYNCDRPIPQPLMAKDGDGVFVDSLGKKLICNSVNICQAGQNILWKYPMNSTYKYSAGYKNVAWVVLPDFSIAVLLPDDKSKLSDKTIVMSVLPIEKAIPLIEANI